MPVRLILVGTQHAENLAAVLRSARAFGVEDVWLVQPSFTLGNVEGRIARRGEDLLERVRVTERLDDAIQDLDVLLAGSAKDAVGRNLLRDYLPLRDAVMRVKQAERVGFLFGREDTGLRDEELRLADVWYTIPTVPPQRALNLAHAVSITLYEYHVQTREAGRLLPRASRVERDVLYALIMRIVQEVNEQLGVRDLAARLRVQGLVWRRVLGTADLSDIDVRSLLGFFRDVEKLLTREKE